MIEFLYFTFGILFVSFVLPLLDGILSTLLSWLEVIKGYASVKVAKCNQEITSMKDDDSKSDTRVIGFQISPEEEEDYEEEEEDE